MCVYWKIECINIFSMWFVFSWAQSSLKEKHYEETDVYS